MTLGTRKSEAFLYLALGVAAIGAVLYWMETGFERAGFYQMVTFLSSILLVYVTARYVFVFERDATTRQRVQENWEGRRFYANRMFTIGDVFNDLYFASKHELQIFILEWEALDKWRENQVNTLNPKGAGYIEALANIHANHDFRYEQARLRYTDKSKEYYWRAEGLLHQAKQLFDGETVRAGEVIFGKLSAQFVTLDEAKAILARYDELQQQFSGLVTAIHAAADRKLHTP